MKGLLNRAIIAPILALLRQGVTPNSLALCTAIGIVVGLIPILGISTLLCSAIALAFRLNFAAIQISQAAMAPIQLLLIIPFVRLGEWIMRAPAQPVTISAGTDLLKQGVWHAVVVLREAILHAAVAWTIVAPLAVFALYRILRPAFTHVALRSVGNLKNVPI